MISGVPCPERGGERLRETKRERDRERERLVQRLDSSVAHLSHESTLGNAV